MLKWIITSGSVVAVVAASFTFFGTYGWITRMAYAADHGDQPIAVQMVQIQKSLETIITSQQLIRSEWRCSEISGELPELELQKIAAMGDWERIKIEQRIENLKELWDDLGCSRFTE